MCVSDKRQGQPQGQGDGPAVYPLSFAQQRLWFLEQLDPGRADYNVPLALEFRGMLDVGALEAGLSEIMRRHQALRTRFPAVNGQPVQRVVAAEPVALERVDVTAAPAQARLERARRLTEAEAGRPFDLERGPLLRGTLYCLGPEHHVLALTVHHIVLDAWSVGILVAELQECYRAAREGRPPDLPELPVQYVDFAFWQRQSLTGDELQRQLEFWRNHLRGGLPVLELPTDSPRPPVKSFRGGTETATLPEDTAGWLAELGREERASPFMILLAAFYVLLSRYGNAEDVVVGTPVANRNRRELENMIGFFVNTVALRADLTGNPTFRRLLGHVRERMLQALEHQEIPFERVVEELQPQRDLGHTPLFQAMFVHQQDPAAGLDLPQLEVRTLEIDPGTSKFDLTLFVWECAGGFRAAVEYSTDLFTAATAKRMLRHYETLLRSIAQDPDARLSDLTLLPAEERRRVLRDWNSTSAPYPEGRCLHHLFEERARTAPHEPAVIRGDEGLTYAQLERRAERLARRLRRLGVGPDVPVGLCVRRSPDMAVGVLGILKAGGACLPLDPAYPSDRLGFMLQDAGVPVLVTHEGLAGDLPAGDAAVVYLDESLPGDAVPSVATETAHGGEPAAAGGTRTLSDNGTLPGSAAMPDSLAYIIYTSGSTGRPKGVAMPHRPLVNLVAWQLRHSAVGAGDRTLQFAPLSFDVAFQEMFATWAAGGTLVLPPDEARQDLSQLPALLTDAGVRRLFLPFVALQQLAEVCGAADRWPRTLREVITAGEQLQASPAVKRLFAELGGTALHNQYGPSETHVVTAFELTGPPDDWPSLPPIGRPIANVEVYLLDGRLRPVPIGVPGELYIGGAAVARGYLARPRQTAERFVPDPLGCDARPGSRLYRTGDLGRWLPSGDIEFLGRADLQAKVRGFRVEPGEIEGLLTEHPGVREAVVTARDYAPGDRRLVAYLVFEGRKAAGAPDGAGERPSAADLRRFLGRRLPEYMLPAAFVPLEALPLTPSGKVDRRALPAPEGAALESPEEYVAPGTRYEEEICRIWSRILGRDRIGVHDNFFDLGGHSLLGTRLMSALKQALHVDLPLRALFRQPTVAGLAGAVEEALLSAVEDEELSRMLDELEGTDDD